MRRIFPDVKPPAVPGIYELSSLLPDPNRPAPRDVAQRNLYLAGELESEHTTLSVSDTSYADVDGLPQRIRSLEVSAVSGGTVTVQCYVDGVPLYSDAERPVSGGGTTPVPAPFIFPAGAEVKTVIEDTTGTPTGTASVPMSTEPYILLGRYQPVDLHGAERLKVSARQQATALNTAGVPAGAERASRLYAYSFGGTSPLTASSTNVSTSPRRSREIPDVTVPRPRPIPRYTPSSRHRA